MVARTGRPSSIAISGATIRPLTMRTAAPKRPSTIGNAAPFWFSDSASNATAASAFGDDRDQERRQRVEESDRQHAAEERRRDAEVLLEFGGQQPRENRGDEE